MKLTVSSQDTEQTQKFLSLFVLPPVTITSGRNENGKSLSFPPKSTNKPAPPKPAHGSFRNSISGFRLLLQILPPTVQDKILSSNCLLQARNLVWF